MWSYDLVTNHVIDFPKKTIMLRIFMFRKQNQSKTKLVLIVVTCNIIEFLILTKVIYLHCVYTPTNKGNLHCQQRHSLQIVYYVKIVDTYSQRTGLF